MDVPDAAVFPNDSVIALIFAGVANPLLNLFQERRSIAGMHPAQYRIEGHFRCWVQTENTETLLAEVNISSRNAPCPASRVAESLPFAQIGLASLQGLFRPLAFRYVPVDAVNLGRPAVHAGCGCYERHIKMRSIFSLTDHFCIDPLTAFQRIAQRFRLSQGSIRHNQVIDVSSECLVNRVANNSVNSRFALKT